MKVKSLAKYSLLMGIAVLSSGLIAFFLGIFSPFLQHISEWLLSHQAFLFGFRLLLIVLTGFYVEHKVKRMISKSSTERLVARQIKWSVIAALLLVEFIVVQNGLSRLFDGAGKWL